MDVCLKENNRIISIVRFPLIVGVVFIHSLSIPHGSFMVYDFFYYSLNEILCDTCVPLFFFFSGYFIGLDSSYSFSIMVFTRFNGDDDSNANYLLFV